MMLSCSEMPTTHGDAERAEGVCKQRQDLWGQRSGSAQTAGMKETVMLSCREMRTVASSVRQVITRSLTGRQKEGSHCLCAAHELSLTSYLLYL